MKLTQFGLPLLLVAALAIGIGCQATSSTSNTADSDAKLQFYVANGSSKLMDRLKIHQFQTTTLDTNSANGKIIKALLGAKTDEFLIVLNPIINRPLAVLGITDKTDWGSIDSALDKIEKMNTEGPKHLKRLKAEGDGHVKLVLFSDYQCPHCGLMETIVDGWQKRYGEKLDVDFINFPLPGHPQAQPAAQAAECARKQNKFDAYQQLLFSNQKKLTPALYFDFAKKTGLKSADFRKCMESGETIETVQSDMAFGNYMVVRGTPTLFINGELVEGMTQQEIESKLDGLLKASASK
jgi:predicted DsbA family dithiol-disulfide isomerase